MTHFVTVNLFLPNYMSTDSMRACRVHYHHVRCLSLCKLIKRAVIIYGDCTITLSLSVLCFKIWFDGYSFSLNCAVILDMRAGEYFLYYHLLNLRGCVPLELSTHQVASLNKTNDETLPWPLYALMLYQKWILGYPNLSYMSPSHTQSFISSESYTLGPLEHTHSDVYNKLKVKTFHHIVYVLPQAACFLCDEATDDRRAYIRT